MQPPSQGALTADLTRDLPPQPQHDALFQARDIRLRDAHEVCDLLLRFLPAAAEAEALTWPGVYYVRTWLNEGRCEVGDSLMYVLIGADIRPNCIDALQKLVGHIKNELVVEKEIFE